ncbi:MAG: restriction endonuclease [Tepidisphaeraceae bacterium]
MPDFWMVRCGSSGQMIDDFLDKSIIAIGFEDIDLTSAHTKAEVKAKLLAAGHKAKPASVGVLHRFRSRIHVGDRVVTYDRATRQYSFGEVTGDYRYEPRLIAGVAHVRSVKWTGKVLRDDLSASSRNRLGGLLTVFEPGDDVLKEMEQLLAGTRAVVRNAGDSANEDESESTDVPGVREDTEDRAREAIKDRISALDWDELQDLVAAILRAMGFKTRVSPPGSDRGKDIVASPDGLGLTPPRIKVEVKHRREKQMGAPEIRGFIGGLRGDDRGLYVSTGGFTKEAHYEAERSSLPVNLIDLEVLAALLVQHYEGLDAEGKALIPLTRIYLPARDE